MSRTILSAEGRVSQVLAADSQRLPFAASATARFLPHRVQAGLSFASFVLILDTVTVSASSWNVSVCISPSPGV
jgi:hypothetical protein